MQFIEHTEPQEPALILLSASQESTRFFLSPIGKYISLNLFQIATMNMPFYCAENRTFTFSNFQLNRFSSASHTVCERARTRIQVTLSQNVCTVRV